jgi:hypothetical protein
MTVYDYKVVPVVSGDAGALEQQLNAAGEGGFAVVGVAEHSAGHSLVILQRATTEVDEDDEPAQVPRRIR